MGVVICSPDSQLGDVKGIGTRGLYFAELMTTSVVRVYSGKTWLMKLGFA